MKDGTKREGRVQPAYRALADELRSAIFSGEFPPNRQLPTEVELARSHNVSRQTVRQAFAQLVSDSLVYRVPGRGTFATSFPRSGPFLRSMGSVDETLALSTDTELEVVEPLATRANVEGGVRLQLPTDEVMQITFTRAKDRKPLCMTTVVLPPWVGEAISPSPALFVAGGRSTETVVGLIERSPSISPIAGTQQSITAVAATPELARHTDLSPSEPMLRFDRVYYDRDGNHLEWATTYFNPTRYSYRVELRRA